MSLFRFFRSTRPERSHRHRTILKLEALEDRCLPSVSTISGFVFSDANNNGLFDTGEHGLSGSQIELLNSAGTVIGTATTDANGFYQFNADGTISTAPTTLTRNVSYAGGTTGWTQTQTVPQFDPALGTLTSVDIINAGTVTSDIKVENLEVTPATVTGTVSGRVLLSGPGISSLMAQGSDNESFDATAFDGSIDFTGTSGHDFGSKTVNGQQTLTITDPTALAAYIGTGTVTLSAQGTATSQATGGGNVISWITSSSSAQVSVVYHYTASNALRPGSYTIVEMNDPTGYFKGENTQGNVTPLANSAGSHSIPVTLAAGSSTNNNFGEIAAASLNGSVYVDQNDNGVLDPGEAPLSGVKITLTGTNDLGQAITLTQTTAADGSYHFTGLRPGTYTVTETHPAGYFDGKATPGNLGGTASTDQLSAIALAAGAVGQNYNFGELVSASLSGFVYLDHNNDGIKQATEKGIGNILITLTGVDDLGNAVTLTRRTAADGSYHFTGLRPGTYSITETPPRNYLQGKATVGSLGGTIGANLFSQIIVTSGATGASYNFGHVPLPVPHVPPPPPSTPTTTTTISKYNFLASTVWGW